MSNEQSQDPEKWNQLWELISLAIQRLHESMDKPPSPTLSRELSTMLLPRTPDLQTAAARIIHLDSVHASEVSEMLRIPLDRERLLYAKRPICLLACWRLEEMRRFVGLHVNDAFDAFSTIFPFPDLSEQESYTWLVNKWWIHAGRADAARYFEAETQPPTFAG